MSGLIRSLLAAARSLAPICRNPLRVASNSINLQISFRVFPAAAVCITGPCTIFCSSSAITESRLNVARYFTDF